VFDRADNNTLRGILVELWDKTLRSRAMVLLDRPEFVAQRMQEHQAILEAFRARDPEAVGRLWWQHIDISGEETREYFSVTQATAGGQSLGSAEQGTDGQPRMGGKSRLRLTARQGAISLKTPRRFRHPQGRRPDGTS